MSRGAGEVIVRPSGRLTVLEIAQLAPKTESNKESDVKGNDGVQPFELPRRSLPRAATASSPSPLPPSATRWSSVRPQAAGVRGKAVSIGSELFRDAALVENRKEGQHGDAHGYALLGGY